MIFRTQIVFSLLVSAWVTLIFNGLLYFLPLFDFNAVSSLDKFTFNTCFWVLSFFSIFIFYHYFIGEKLKSIQQIVKLDNPKNNAPYSLSETKKLIENQVLKANKEVAELKKLEQYRKEFLGNVSHELKTPIFNIQGYLETILEEQTPPPAMVSDYIQKALKNAERLQDIVHDLLQISEYETSSMIHVESYSIGKQIKEIFDSFQLTAKAKNIQLVCMEDYTSVFVLADKIAILQVLSNLVSNAIKYGNENGFVSIKITPLENQIKISVSDNGNGISKEHIGRLFERFYRVDKARSRDKGGTGLGLAIVKHILEAHKQTIQVESQIGVGTSFEFHLEKGN